MIALVAAGVLAPFFFEATPEVRSTYVSLGKIVEDRPMQITLIRAGVDAGAFGRFGVRNWDVSSLTDRRADAHRHALYHTEFGPTWQHDFDIAEGWRIKSDVTRIWTIYRGFQKSADNRTYGCWQIDQSLENPYIVPFYRLRRTFKGNDYLYFKLGLRRKFAICDDFSLTPAVLTEGGNSRNQRRVFGAKPDHGRWRHGVSSVTFRLEASWQLAESVTAFVFVEQYEVVGGSQRSANAASSYRCAHNDWTLGGIGVRFRF